MLKAIVGLPDAAVQESRERVRAAIRNTGLRFPDSRLTVNLAPADLLSRTVPLTWGRRAKITSMGRGGCIWVIPLPALRALRSTCP
jgi:hypothetical protein